MAGCILINTVDTQAASGTGIFKYDAKNGIFWQSGLRLPVRVLSMQSEIFFQNPDYYVASVKANRPGLIAKVSMDEHTDDNLLPSYMYPDEAVPTTDFRRHNSIQFYARKKGNYTVTLTVKNSAGVTVCKKKIIVCAGYGSDPIASLTYAGKKYNEAGAGLSISTRKASGKLKIKVASGYRIRKIEVATSYDAKGNPVFKQVKNGARITLAKKTKYKEIFYRDSYSDIVDEYTCEAGSFYNYLKPVTIIRVTYYDTRLKLTPTLRFYIINVK